MRVMFGPIEVPAWVIKQVFEKLPEDAVMITHIHDPQRLQWGWIIASMEFPVVEEGAVLPPAVVSVDGVKKTVEITRPVTVDSFEDALKAL